MTFQISKFVGAICSAMLIASASSCTESDPDYVPILRFNETTVPVDQWIPFAIKLPLNSPRSTAWGFKTPDGRIVVEPDFDSVFKLGENCFAVQSSEQWYVFDENATLINRQGYGRILPFKDGLAWVGLPTGRFGWLWGIIDTT